MNYYNENDPKAAAWLRELVSAGEIAPGHIDSRSIVEVRPEDLVGYSQCHFFAGIGGWPYALRLAGWPNDKPVWTGSCPCQPFSVAGKGLGAADERHLWPIFSNLIRECRPPVAFGEQVASKAGREWLAGVRADLEGMGYAVGAADLCAAGAGAPHIRQRLFWVAESESARGCWRRQISERRNQEFGGPSAVDGLADTDGERRTGVDPLLRPKEGGRGEEAVFEVARSGVVDGLGHADDPRPQGREQQGNGAYERAPWAASVVLCCTDGKTRRIPIEPALFPLAHGVSGRVGLLRGYGNAIVPQVAAQFVQAYLT